MTMICLAPDVERRLEHAASDAVGDNHGRRLVRPRHQDGELLAAESAGESLARTARPSLGRTPADPVAGIVARTRG